MKNRLIFIFLCALASIGTMPNLYAQPTKPKVNAIFLDLGGPGGLASINYEQKLFELLHIQVYAQVGLSTYKIIDFTRKFNPDIIVPMGLMFTSQDKKFQPIISIGSTYSNSVHATPYGKTRDAHLHMWSKIGYRYNFNDSPIYLQASYVSIREQEVGHRNWGGISIGYKI